MTFKEQIASELSSVFLNTDEFAETVTYNGAEIAAILDPEEGVPGRDLNADERAIQIRVADVAAPGYRDTVVIGGETWRAARDARGGPVLRRSGGDMWILVLTRDERPMAE